MEPTVIVSTVRTPVGYYMSGLKAVDACDLIEAEQSGKGAA
ncbi:MAG: hypothetical protein WAM73_12960 [Desulfobacterales bacterium]